MVISVTQTHTFSAPRNCPSTMSESNSCWHFHDFTSLIRAIRLFSSKNGSEGLKYLEIRTHCSLTRTTWSWVWIIMHGGCKCRKFKRWPKQKIKRSSVFTSWAKSPENSNAFLSLVMARRRLQIDAPTLRIWQSSINALYTSLMVNTLVSDQF